METRRKKKKRWPPIFLCPGRKSRIVSKVGNFCILRKHIVNICPGRKSYLKTSKHEILYYMKKNEAIPPTGGKIQYFSSTGIYEREKRKKDGCQTNFCMHIRFLQLENMKITPYQ